MAVIKISREFGSGGDQIAQHVCELLGYRYFDKTLVAQERGFSDVEAVDFSEDSYELRSFIDTLLRPPFSITSEWIATPSGEEIKRTWVVNEETAAEFVTATAQ